MDVGGGGGGSLVPRPRGCRKTLARAVDTRPSFLLPRGLGTRLGGGGGGGGGGGALPSVEHVDG